MSDSVRCGLWLQKCWKALSTGDLCACFGTSDLCACFVCAGAYWYSRVCVCEYAATLDGHIHAQDMLPSPNHTETHTSMHTRKRYRPALVHTTHTHAHTCTYIHPTQTLICACICACKHRRLCTHTRVRMHAHRHIYYLQTHTNTRACAHTGHAAQPQPRGGQVLPACPGPVGSHTGTMGCTQR